MLTKPTLSMVFVCIIVASAASADTTLTPPINGTYLSTDLGGNVLTGRFSASWVGTTPGHGQPGNTILATSVNGPAMGTQWELWCASITDHPMLLTDVRDSTSTGEVTWRVEYTGGQFWLAGDGPWAAVGSSDFIGVIETMTATMMHLYENGSIIGIFSSFTLAGKFDPGTWDGSCIECTINDMTYLSSTDQETKPADYPPFMAPDCGPWTSGTGAWGDVSGVTIVVLDCTETPVQETTWGGIKVLYDR